MPRPSNPIAHGKPEQNALRGICICLGLACLMLGCGKRKALPGAPAPAQGATAKDELVALSLKVIDRSDRLPGGDRATAGLSDIALPSSQHSVAGLDPGVDWPSEVLSQAALGQLQKLLAARTAADLDGVVAGPVQCSELNPPKSKSPDGAVELELEDHLVLRHAVLENQATQLLDAEQLLARIRVLSDGEQALQVKVIGVQMSATDPHQFGTRVRVWLGGDDFSYAGTWDCLWEIGPGTPPLLLSIRLDEYEQIRGGSGPWFTDATRAALGASPRFDSQVMRGIEYWSQRITRIGDMAMTGHHGLAVGDVNGDGLEDVYVCDAGSLPNQLYLQQPDGTATEAAARWDVAWLEDSRSALLVDLDNDGDQDLVVATIAMIAFAENAGAGKFVLRGGFPGAPYPFSLSAADFDSDGDLDIYTCVYSAGDESITGKRGFEARSPIPFNDANNGGRNVLLANLGGFQFGDVTAQVGLDQNNTRWSFAAAWEDIDRDGDPDLYVANDFGRNCLYRNDGGTFTDTAAAAGVEDMAAGMSVAWGDYDRDGVADLYVGNMFSAAGSRVGYQRRLSTGQQRMARGNSLFAGNAGGAAFTDLSLPAGATLGGWAWSSAFADLNNDGWQDLVIANGYLTNTRDDDL